MAVSNVPIQNIQAPSFRGTASTFGQASDAITRAGQQAQSLSNLFASRKKQEDLLKQQAIENQVTQERLGLLQSAEQRAQEKYGIEKREKEAQRLAKSLGLDGVNPLSKQSVGVDVLTEMTPAEKEQLLKATRKKAEEEFKTTARGQELLKGLETDNRLLLQAEGTPLAKKPDETYEKWQARTNKLLRDEAKQLPTTGNVDEYRRKGQLLGELSQYYMSDASKQHLKDTEVYGKELGDYMQGALDKLTDKDFLKKSTQSQTKTIARNRADVRKEVTNTLYKQATKGGKSLDDFEKAALETRVEDYMRNVYDPKANAVLNAELIASRQAMPKSLQQIAAEEAAKLGAEYATKRRFGVPLSKEAASKGQISDKEYAEALGYINQYGSWPSWLFGAGLSDEQELKLAQAKAIRDQKLASEGIR